MWSRGTSSISILLSRWVSMVLIVPVIVFVCVQSDHVGCDENKGAVEQLEWLKWRLILGPSGGEWYLQRYLVVIWSVLIVSVAVGCALYLRGMAAKGL